MNVAIIRWSFVISAGLLLGFCATIANADEVQIFMRLSDASGTIPDLELTWFQPTAMQDQTTPLLGKMILKEHKNPSGLTDTSYVRFTVLDSYNVAYLRIVHADGPHIFDWDCQTVTLTEQLDQQTVLIPATQGTVVIGDTSPPPEREPVSCRIAPDANTLTGSFVVWGQTHHSAVRTNIDPRDAAYPANLYSGEVNEKVVDLHVKGRGLDFVWSRRYRSRDGKTSGIGNQWDHSYNISAEYDAGPDIFEVAMGNGRTERFTFSSFSGGVFYYFADGWEAQLADSLNGVDLRFGNGIVWEFPYGGGPIERIVDRYGNEITFQYDGSDRLDTITDTLGRDYEIAYGSDNFIDSITEAGGLNRVVSYTHYGASETDGNLGDLKSVSYPAISGTVTGNDFPSGRSLTYTYDKSPTLSLNGNVLTIKDGRNNTVCTNSYDSSDRVIKQVWGSDGATDAVVSFDYPAIPTGLIDNETRKTIVNDGEGNVCELYFSVNNRLERMREFTGKAVSDQPTTETSNRPMNKIRSSDPAYFETQFDWNSHDLLVEQRNPRGNRVVYTYNTTDRKRIAELSKSEQFEGAAGMAKLTAEFGHGETSFQDCRCGEQFVTRKSDKDDAGQIDFDIAYDYHNTNGSLTGISHGALAGFPSTLHETYQYNAAGQVTSHTFPDNGEGVTRQDTYSYFTTGPQTGYLQSVTADAGTGNLKTSYAYNNAGQVTEITAPNGHSGGTPQAAWKTLLTYNSNDELIRRETPTPSDTVATRNGTDFIYDANGNVVTVKVENRGADGNSLVNAVVETAFTYDTLNRQTQTVAEVDGSSSVTSQVAYNRNGLPVKMLSPLAVSSAEPANMRGLLYDERNLLYQSVRGVGDANRITTQFDYDGNGNLTLLTEGMESGSDRRQTTYTYDLLDRLDFMLDALGNKTDFEYDGAGNTASTKRYSGASTQLTQTDYVFDISGRNTQIAESLRDATGAVISGTVNGVATGDGIATTAITYTAASDVKTVTFEENPQTLYHYDRLMRVASIIDPKLNTVAYTYDGNSNVTQVVSTEKDDTGGADQEFMTQFQYDHLNRMVARKERYSTASGGQFNTETFSYDSRNNLVAQTDARGNDSTYAYDGLSRQLTASSKIGASNYATTTTAYDANSRVTSKTDPENKTTQYSFDPFDRLTKATYADSAKQTLKYNRFGDQTESVDATGTKVSQTFDKLGRLTGSTTTPASGFTTVGTKSYLYDALSRATSATDGDTVTTYLNDSFGNVYSESQQVSGGATRTTAYVFDDNNNCKKLTYPGGRTLTYTHDGLNRTVTVSDTSGLIADIDYVGGRVARRVNGNGTQVDNAFDGLGAANESGDFGSGEIVSTVHSKPATTTTFDERSYKWDQDGNKTRRVDERTVTTQDDFTNTYDGLGRMTDMTPDSGSVSTYTYDKSGNRTNSGYTMEGSNALLHQYTVTPSDTRGYDRLGNVASYDARAKWYEFDSEGRLIRLIEAGSRTQDDFSASIPVDYIVDSGTWAVSQGVLSESTSASGRILRNLPTGTTELTFSYKSPHDYEDTADYDPERYGLAIARLFESNWKYAALVIEPTGLYLREWDDATLVAELGAATVSAKPDTWYDVKVVYSGTDNRTVNVYWAKRGDPWPTTANLAGTLSAALAEAVGQKTGFGVGANGEYSFRDVQFRDPGSTANTTVSEYKYDALGRRVAKILNPGLSPTVTEYVYDGNQLIEERDGSNNVIASFVYGPGIDEPIAMTRGANTYYYHQDDLGNVVALTDGNDGLTEGDIVERYDYGAFGAPTIYEADGTTPRTASIAENPYLFTGREWNPELNAYWYRTRYYDPTAGRFLSRDTIGLWGDPANLGNPYTYVNNNPWSMGDPYGEGPLTWLLADDYGASDWTTAVGIAEASGLGLKGLFWTGPKNTVVGIGTVIVHPIETGKGVINFGVAVVDDPGAVGGAIWNDIKTIPQDPERIGSAVFDVALGFATGGTMKTGATVGRIGKIAETVDDFAQVAKTTARPRIKRLPIKASTFDDSDLNKLSGSRVKWGAEHGKGNTAHNNAIEDVLDAAAARGATGLRKNRVQRDLHGNRVYTPEGSYGKPDAAWVENGMRHNYNRVSNPADMQRELDAFKKIIEADPQAGNWLEF